MSRDVLGRDDPLLLGDVCQHVGPFHVTDSVHARDAGAHVVVDDDALVRECYAQRLEFGADVRPASDGQQNVVTVDVLRDAVHVECQGIARLRGRDRLGLRPGDDRNTSLLESCGEGLCHVLVLGGQDMGHQLDDGDLGSDGAEERRHLDADDATTNDYKLLRLFPVAEDVVAGPDARVGEGRKPDG